MDTDLELIERPWDPREGEPLEWYRIFKDYYLPLGNQRSLRNAFEFFVRVEQPSHYADVSPDDIRFAPQHWNTFAAQWEWAKRAMAYDEGVHPDFTALYVTTALGYLQEHAKSAAEALVQALNNDRTRVQAANSILNRAGVPEVSEVLLKGSLGITSDDMAAASEKVEKWKTQNKSG